MSSLVIVCRRRRRFCFTCSLELQGEEIFFFPFYPIPSTCLSVRKERGREKRASRLRGNINLSKMFCVRGRDVSIMVYLLGKKARG